MSTGKGSYLFRDGAVCTMDPAQAWAQAVVVNDGVITYVGTSAGAAVFVDDSTEVVDLAGGMLLPGFIDSHTHFVTGPLTKVGVNVGGIVGKDNVLAAIAEYIKANPGLAAVRGSAWMPASFDDVSPRREWLDEVTGDVPALIFSADIHDAWFNTALMKLAGLDKDTPDPLPGAAYYWRDEDGTPSGRASEGPAILPLAVAIGAFSKAGLEASIQVGIMAAPSMGLTAYLDAAAVVGGSPESAADAFAIFTELDAAGELPLRITGSHVTFGPGDDHDRTLAVLKDWNSRFASEHVQVSICKVLADGVMQSGGGLLLDPFANDHSSCGRMTWNHEGLVEIITKVQQAGFDMHIHVDADGTAREVLDAVADVQAAIGQGSSRHQVAHCSMVHPDDIGRFVDLGLMANLTTLWGTDYNGQYIDIYTQLIGPERMDDRLFPYGDLVRAGAKITIGSDFPAVELDEIAPLVQIEAAVTRKRPGYPDDQPLVERQRMSLHDALLAYTVNGAYGQRIDDRVGSIEVGKQADLVFLAQDLYAVPADQIHAVPVKLTMMHGRITHDAR